MCMFVIQVFEGMANSARYKLPPLSFSKLKSHNHMDIAIYHSQGNMLTFARTNVKLCF